MSIRRRHEAAVFVGERKEASGIESPLRIRWEPLALPIHRFIRCIFVAVALSLGAANARADAITNIDAANLNQAANSLQQVETALQQPGLSKDVLQKLDEQTQPLGPQLQNVLDRLTPRLAAQKAQLDQLGPAPAANAPPEAKDVAAERVSRQKAFDDLDSLVKRANLLIVQTQQAQATIAARLRARLAESLLQQEPSLASPWLWRDVIGEAPANFVSLRDKTGAWLAQSHATLAGWRTPVFWSLVFLVLALYWPVTRITQHAAFRKPTTETLTPLHKVLAAWRVLFAVAALPIAAVLILGGLARSFGLINLNLHDEPLLRAFFFSALRVAIAAGLARALLAPKLREWRLLDIDDDTAAQVYRTILIVTIVISFSRIASGLGEVVEASWASQTFLRGFCALLSAGAIAACLWIGQSEEDDSEEIFGPRTSRAANWFGILRTLLWAVVLIVIAAVIAGYMTLSRFIVDQVIWVGGVGALALMLVMLVDSVVGGGITGSTPLGRRVMLSTGLGREAFEQAAILAAGVARVVIFLIAVLAALAPWGVQSTDVTGYLYAAFFGFKIGDVTISISRVVFTLLIFIAGFAATRVVERWLEMSFLPHTRLDIGLRNAIITSFGYVGRIIALGLALAYLGVDFAKLAIVAGALSVGIGFGLQSIVNNFVSGLILLWERVIRVGDWISVGANEGFVRRINVRSTEIETFDRAAVVIPNSDLVAGVVKNFIRTDKTGRVKINIPVNAAADPQKAREVLLAVAANNKNVLKKPAPFVVFAEITGSVFNFELYCFVTDVTSMKSVTSELNFEIYNRFRAEKLFDAPPPMMNINLPELEKQGFILREPPNGKAAQPRND
jgi:potassium-dependent mechanosensitive channel